MHEQLIGIALIVILGVGAQWIAWRIRIPSILLLLLAGFTVGPIAEWISGERILDPDGLLGDILAPLVSISVGIILYEGGLTLRLREITGVRNVVRNLVSVGALVAWIGAAAAAYFIVGLSASLATLVGAILVVTGPTVIGPLLQHIRPKGRAGPILKWESIVIDPIGALLAVLVFEVIIAGHGAQGALGGIAQSVFLTVVAGGGLGLAAGVLLMVALQRHWVPDHLQNPVSLLLAVAAIVGSDLVQKEAGLLAATVMGIFLANQTRADVRHILEFKENLRVLLISSLFVVLGARITAEQLTSIGLPELFFVVALIVVVRPLSVVASTAGSELTRRDRIFLALMAPRGIVAAAVASVFALRLEQAGTVPGAESVLTTTFAAIVGTVAFYGLTAPLAARRLGLADANPQGTLIVGASEWARALARALNQRGVRVLLVDSNRENLRAARMAGLPVFYGNILSDHALDQIDLTGLGRLIAATPNDEVNSLAVQRFAHIFGRAQLYQVAPHRQTSKSERQSVSREFLGRILFDDAANFEDLERRIASGHVVKTTTLTDEFTFDDYRTLYGSSAVVLCRVTPMKTVSLNTAGADLDPQPGDAVVALVDPEALFIR